MVATGDRHLRRNVQELESLVPPRQRDALDPQELSKYPPADLTVERIGDLLEIDLRVLLAASRSAE